MATVSRLKSGSWRAQVRRKGNYVNETLVRRKDAEERALDIERRIDRQEPATSRAREAKLFGDLITLHRQDLEEVGKTIGRSKDASLNSLTRGSDIAVWANAIANVSSGSEKSARKRARGPMTVGIDLGYIKTIFSHAAAAHGVTVSIEPINLARIALGRLGLVGKGNERDGRPTQKELDLIIASLEANDRQQIPVDRIIRFAVATAMRQDEIARIECA